MVVLSDFSGITGCGLQLPIARGVLAAEDIFNRWGSCE